MNIHENARMTVHGRALLVSRICDDGWRVGDAAEAAGVSERTAYKWLARYRAGGAAALVDRQSTPGRCPHGTPAEQVAAIEGLRRQRMSGPAIARKLSMPRSTVGAILRRLRLGRLAALDVKPAAVRYERERPGELIHIDTKKLGRIDGVGHRTHGDHSRRARKIGWEHLHVAVDDASRLAYTELLPDERKQSACAFLTRALAFFTAHGISVERVMSDTAPPIAAISSRACLPTPTSGTSAPGPTRRAPTARPSASSRPACANGPTPTPTSPPPSEAKPCSPGSQPITTPDPTQPWPAHHPSQG